MAVSGNLRRLVDLSAPYWAGEAEVAWTYFQSPRHRLSGAKLDPQQVKSGPADDKLARETLTRGQWDEIGTMSRKILLQRIHMRNEQFGYPVAAKRIREIEAGRIEPMPFDYAGLE